MELDLDRPLSPLITVQGMKLNLEYEDLHSICFRCGKYGHRKENYREILEVMEKQPLNYGSAPLANTKGAVMEEFMR